MKKLFLALCIFLSASAYSQNLDTVFVRNLSMPAGNYALAAAAVNIYADSATASAVRKIRTVAQSIPSITWNTTMTVDSLPGRFVLGIYREAKAAPAGIVATVYTAIINAISAKTVLSPWITAIDAGYSQQYEAIRNRGKTILID